MKGQNLMEGHVLINCGSKRPEGWKMVRILSYDHGPALQTPTSIYLDKNNLSKFEGSYKSEEAGSFVIVAKDGWLEIKTKDSLIEIYPEDLLVFKSNSGANTRFTFNENAANAIKGITISEPGHKLDEAIRMP